MVIMGSSMVCGRVRTGNNVAQHGPGQGGPRHAASPELTIVLGTHIIVN